jgi:hypothetical protein
MRLLPASVVSLLLASSLLAQYTPPVDVKSILAGLQDLKDKHTKTSKTQLAQTVADFSNAAANEGAALNFYLEAVRVTQFVGQPKEQTAFRDWKKKESDKLNPAAIRTCLRYTTLTLQRSAGATDQQIFPALLSYAQDTQSQLAAIADQDILRQPVANNIFSRWYNLSEQLSGLENWEPAPGNIESIYGQILLPYMRKNRDPRILQYWDKKIADETSRASNATAEFSTDTFNQIRRPELLWSRAQDVLAIGRRDEAITEMYGIVKNFPAHPSAGKWIEELQGILLPPPPAAAAAAASSSAANPPPQ